MTAVNEDVEHFRVDHTFCFPVVMNARIKSTACGEAAPGSFKGCREQMMPQATPDCRILG